MIQTVPEEDRAILDHHEPQRICFADAGGQNLRCCEMGKAPDASRLKKGALFFGTFFFCFGLYFFGGVRV